MSKMNVLGVIPARGGSKGIPKKNIRPLCGHPLIYYTIKSAKESSVLSDFIVTTDDMEIKNISEHYGAKVPFMRPKELSGDKALAIPTIRHAVLFYEKIVGFMFDYIIMLQPTAPLRLAKDIDRAINILIDNNSDSIISVVNVENFHPMKMKIINNNFLYDYVESKVENPPRQGLPEIYIVNGAIYAVKRDVFIKENTFKGEKCLPYVMESDDSINIDAETDFLIAEHFIKRRINEKK